MATSESDDFESADEELDNLSAPAKRVSPRRARAVVDSDSDDTDWTSSKIDPSYGTLGTSDTKRKRASPTFPKHKPSSIQVSLKNLESEGKSDDTVDPKPALSQPPAVSQAGKEAPSESNTSQDLSVPDEKKPEPSNETGKSDGSVLPPKTKDERQATSELSTTASGKDEVEKPVTETVSRPKRERQQRQQKQREPRSLGEKKLGSKITSEDAKPRKVEGAVKSPIVEKCWEELDDILSKPRPDIEQRKSKWDSSWDDPTKPKGADEEIEENIEVPEELKSNKKFKEVFKSDGWGDMDEDVEIPDEMSEEKILPVLDKLSLAGEEQNKNAGWGWGGWGVSSLINTASAGVTSLTNHVSHGLTMLEESIGVPDPEELAKTEESETEGSKTEGVADERSQLEKEPSDTQSQSSFGFGNLMSGVSSITKLVESTSNKVIAGGLDTLETIGKKTMEVLQDGDPGLKKKRAFFTQDSDKPILSQMLREAKDKAETEEKTLEEKQLARKVHFESLFDDYQGLVHLEALEMLSKQCDIKIQQHMINLNADELCSVQETLDEVKELCDLGDDDGDDVHETDLQERLKGACKDLGVTMTYDKLIDTWEQTRAYLSTVISTESVPADREVFQRAISTLAQFTALSVERFHKTAELLLVKERRSTVNEADALVQLTNILAGEVGVIANLFADKLNERVKHSDKPDATNANITTIFLEAANASSYIQDAFKLLIPVLQVGAT
ncbi:protein FAM114A2 isoform X1 [Neodiprion fabricii]|uniref:protein FAM114A2 isoform X1 n=1 Tax=Neodiprion fabricii TaxID=2872261 RepID=UPI001ED941D7|nr:protein FAM114A2 isoform X1 [Neodiprion fabricii]